MSHPAHYAYPSTASHPVLDLSPEAQSLPASSASSTKTRDSWSNAFDAVPVQPSLIQRAGQSHGHPRRRISLRYFSASSRSPTYGTRGYATKTTEKPAKECVVLYLCVYFFSFVGYRRVRIRMVDVFSERCVRWKVVR